MRVLLTGVGRHLTVLATGLLAACNTETPHSQRAAEAAWRRADAAAAHGAEAEQQVRHERRLRDIDRLRGEAECTELRTQLEAWRGLTTTLACGWLPLAVWLAVEIRRRRALSAVVHDLIKAKGGEQRVELRSARP